MRKATRRLQERADHTLRLSVGTAILEEVRELRERLQESEPAKEIGECEVHGCSGHFRQPAVYSFFTAHEIVTQGTCQYLVLGRQKKEWGTTSVAPHRPKSRSAVMKGSYAEDRDSATGSVRAAIRVLIPDCDRHQGAGPYRSLKKRDSPLGVLVVQKVALRTRQQQTAACPQSEFLVPTSRICGPRSPS